MFKICCIFAETLQRPLTVPATCPATEAVSLRLAKSSLIERSVRDGVEPFEVVVAVIVNDLID